MELNFIRSEPVTYSTRNGMSGGIALPKIAHLKN
jgi:hypothetical protein